MEELLADTSKYDDEYHQNIISKISCYIDKCFTSRQKLHDSIGKNLLDQKGQNTKYNQIHTPVLASQLKHLQQNMSSRSKTTLAVNTKTKGKRKNLNYEYIAIPQTLPPANNFMGYARVIDFMNTPCANLLNDHFIKLGFKVNSVLNNNQHDVSCSYNSAMVAAKLANYEEYWFKLKVDECCYDPRSSTEYDIVEKGNTFLGINALPCQSSSQLMHKPIFLSDTQCTRLFHFYSKLHYNRVYNENNYKRNYASIGIGHSMFKNSILKYYHNLYVTTNSGCPLQIIFVNSMDELPGAHWFVVAFQIENNIQI